MDFTKSIPCPGCDNKEMSGNGAQIGMRVPTFSFKCHECETTIVIIPTSEKYEYTIKATTLEERKQERIDKLIEDNKLKLAEEITAIKESNY